MKKSELADVMRLISRETAGSDVDFVDLAGLMKLAGTAGVTARELRDRLLAWLAREKPKKPDLLAHFEASILGGIVPEGLE